MAPSNAPKPLRAVGVILLVMVALYATMFAKHEMKPKLGLDLSGGTTVTLHPVTQQGKAAPDQQVNEAVNIIRQRVNAFGVSEAEVTKQGGNIVVAVPGAGQKQVVSQVGQTAQLRFRQVLLSGPAAPAAPTTSPSPSPSPSGAAGDSASPSPSAKSKGRAVSGALTKAAPSPAPKSTATSKAKADPTPAPSAPPAAPPNATGDTSGIDPKVLQEFQKFDCAKNNLGQGRTLDPNKQVVACDADGVAKYVLAPAEVLGTRVTDAQAGLPQQGVGGWLVTLNFDGTGSKQFGALTTKVVNLPSPRNQVAIVLDGVVKSAPVINEPITGGSAQITGSFTQQQATDLANVLRYGALPLKFDKSSIEEVSPTLGSDQLRGGLLAGAIGLALVVLYSLIYYRGLSLVSIASLAIAALITYASVVVLGLTLNFRLSLAGIAGLIVAIGITADSFIVFFERLRDEVREGRTLRSAVERGWERARRTIITADAVSFLAALVLWILAVGGVKGFAFTLGLTTLIDVLVVFLFTKPMVTWLARTKFFGGGHPLSGLDPKRLGARKPVTATVTPRRRGTSPREA